MPLSVATPRSLEVVATLEVVFAPHPALSEKGQSARPDGCSRRVVAENRVTSGDLHEFVDR